VNLRDAIEAWASIEGDIVRVDGFLNHRVDPGVIAALGTDVAKRLAPRAPDVILTAEASGIPIAIAAGLEMGLPIVYAKKYVGRGTRQSIAREVASPTKGTEYRVEVFRHALEPGTRIAVVDDFLSGGRTAQALGEIAEEAGCEVVGFVFAIEKTFMPGRALLEAHGWSVEAVVQINSIADGTVELSQG
jgi:xanthine phosphoribosyltransferase